MLPNTASACFCWQKEVKNTWFCTAREHNACIIPVTMSPHEGDMLCANWSSEIQLLEMSWDTQTTVIMNNVILRQHPCKFCIILADQYKLCQHTEETNTGKSKGTEKTESANPKNLSSPLLSTFPQKHLLITVKPYFWLPAMPKALPQIWIPAMLCILLVPQTYHKVATAQTHLVIWRCINDIYSCNSPKAQY